MPLPIRDTALLSMTLDGASDLLAPIRFSARESLSEPYEFTVVAVSPQGDIGPARALHKPACVLVKGLDGATRRFHGLVREIAPLETAFRGLHGYRLVVVPRLWAMTLQHDCRVFQEKTTKEILTTLLDEAGVTRTAFRITADDPTLPYRTQFNESALRFATRLMEEAGWFYFFEQGEAAETLVIADANTAFPAIAATSGETALLGPLSPIAGVAPGMADTRDYNPDQPATDLTVSQATLLQTKGALSPTSFVWPAGAGDRAAAGKRARLRLEAAEARARLVGGTGFWPALAPGHRFTARRADGTSAGEYVVRSVQHAATDETWLTGGAQPSYDCSFEGFAKDTTWRQDLGTARPVMSGIHTAIVLGAEGSGDIHTDDLARVKLRFFWDHRGEAVGGQAIWARIVQPWAGNGLGGQFLPRVGTEVAVAFVDGDPDRPIVLGGLYNGQDKPIFPEAEKQKSGLRSRSVDGGGTAEFSEFSFDDTKGSELVLLHAQRDWLTQVENDLTLKVDNCRIVTVAADDALTVKGNRRVVVKNGNYAEEVSLGNYTLKANAGSVTIEALQSITLKVGANSVKISQQGVTIEGMMVKIAGTMQTELGAPMTKVSGDGMLTLMGGLVKIN